MSIESPEREVEYTVTGSPQTVFAIPFRALDEGDISIYADNVLLSPSLYTVVLTETAGTATFDTAIPVGTVIRIERLVPYTQPYQYPEGGAFPSKDHEESLDRIVMITQQIRDESLRRILRLADDSLLVNVVVPEGAGKFFRWNAGGTALELVSMVDDSIVSLIAAKGDMIRGDAGGAAEVFSVGASGNMLGSYTGKPEYVTGTMVRLTNQSGVALVPNDVVVIDSSHDYSVKTTTTIGDTNCALVGAEPLANAATGAFYQMGIATVNVQGNVTRGNFLRTSATTKRAEDAGTDPGAAGVFAQALFGYAGGGAGNVIAFLLGRTNPGATSTEYIARKTSNQIVNNSTTYVNDTQLKITLPASTIWEFYISMITNSSATPDMKVRFAYPAAATIDWRVEGTSVAMLSASGESALNPTTWYTKTNYQLIGVINVSTTPGDLQLQWAQNVAAAYDTMVMTNSWMRAKRIG